MTKPIIRIHNMATDEVIDREMTDAEYAEHQKQQAADAVMAAERAKEPTLAEKLDSVGVTIPELKKALGL